MKTTEKEQPGQQQHPGQERPGQGQQHPGQGKERPGQGQQQPGQGQRDKEKDKDWQPSGGQNEPNR